MSIVGETMEENYKDMLKEYIKKPADPITISVMEDLKSRSDVGLKKYNTTLGENNKDDYMRHLYEELLDAAQYCKKELSIIPMIQDLISKYPSDQDLGENIRKIFNK